MNLKEELLTSKQVFNLQLARIILDTRIRAASSLLRFTEILCECLYDNCQYGLECIMKSTEEHEMSQASKSRLVAVISDFCVRELNDAWLKAEILAKKVFDGFRVVIESLVNLMVEDERCQASKLRLARVKSDAIPGFSNEIFITAETWAEERRDNYCALIQGFLSASMVDDPHHQHRNEERPLQ